MKEIKPVIDFCEKSFSSGKIIPLSFTFPSFFVDEKIFKENTINIIKDIVETGFDTKNYFNELMISIDRKVEKGTKPESFAKKMFELVSELSFDDLVELEKIRGKANLSNKEKDLFIFMDKVLPQIMEKDENLSNSSILSSKILVDICAARMKDVFINIDHLSNFSAPYGEFTSTTQMEKTKFVATMLMLKEKIPSAYRQINSSFRYFPNSQLVDELKAMEKEPDISVVNIIKKTDSKFAEKNFPQQFKSLYQVEKRATATIK